MAGLLLDLRYGLRMLGKRPGFTLVAVLSLALGIGANTAIFTLINALLLRSLPVERPEELYLFGEGRMSGISMFEGDPVGVPYELISYPLYLEIRDHNQVFRDVCAFGSFTSTLSLRPNGAAAGAPAEQATGKVVSGNYFSVLGVKALLGRTLVPDDDTPQGAHAVAVISYRYWRKEFSGDASVVGRVVDVNGTPFTVVGVTPSQFFGETLESGPADIWMPITMQPQVMLQESFLQKGNVYWLHVLGRLKPGVTKQQAQAAVTLQLQQYLTQQAGSHLSNEVRQDISQARIDLMAGGKGISQLRRRASEPLHILMALVGVVLLISCANVANLLIERAARRQKEISMRLALGASRWRLIRQLLTESVLLAVLGGAAGLLFAAWGTSVILALVSRQNSYLPLSADPDLLVLGFTLVISLGTGVLFGLAPALRATRTDLTSALKEGARTLAGHTSHFGLAKLLVGAGLFVRSLQNLHGQDLGFDRENVLLVGIDPRVAGYQPSQLPSLYRLLQDRVSGLPGVRSASLSLTGLVSGSMRSESISVQGYTSRRGEDTNVQINLVAPRYFETVGMRLLLGREIGFRDTESSAKIAVINETMARYFFPNQNPLGRRFGFGDRNHSGDIEVVGVVRDAKYNSLREKPTRMVYCLVVQMTGGERYLYDMEVRTKSDPATMAAGVRRAIAEIDKSLPLTQVTTLTEQVDRSLSQERLVARLSSFFGLLALLLACIGLYGIMAFAVVRRTNEIGVRMALGARASDVLWMVLREALLLVGAGTVIGLPVALASSRLIASQLFGLTPADPLTISVATLMLAGVATLACYLPARRASRVEPMLALRYE